MDRHHLVGLTLGQFISSVVLVIVVSPIIVYVIHIHIVFM